MIAMVLGRFARAGTALFLFALLVLFTQVGVAASTGCGDSGGCMSVRDSTYALLETWEACDPQKVDACIIEPGNPKDCTGVLTCEFAVNPLYRSQAEQTMLIMGEESRGCGLCAVPNCLTGTAAYCEPASRRCLIIESAEPDAGATGSGGGSLSAIVDDAGADGP
jgi:hypothetical protein